MDLLRKGSVNSKSYWRVEKGKAYSESEKYRMPELKVKKYFRDFLLGLDYCKEEEDVTMSVSILIACVIHVGSAQLRVSRS